MRIDDKIDVWVNTGFKKHDETNPTHYGHAVVKLAEWSRKHGFKKLESTVWYEDGSVDIAIPCPVVAIVEDKIREDNVELSIVGKTTEYYDTETFTQLDKTISKKRYIATNNKSKTTFTIPRFTRKNAMFLLTDLGHEIYEIKNITSNITEGDRGGKVSFFALASTGSKILYYIGMDKIHNLILEIVRGIWISPTECPRCNGRGYLLDGSDCPQCNTYGYSGYNATKSIQIDKGYDVGINRKKFSSYPLTAKQDNRVWRFVNKAWTQNWWVTPTISEIKRMFSEFYNVEDDKIYITERYHDQMPHWDIFVPLDPATGTPFNKSDRELMKYIAESVTPAGVNVFMGFYSDEGYFGDFSDLGCRAFFVNDSIETDMEDIETDWMSQYLSIFRELEDIQTEEDAGMEFAWGSFYHDGKTWTPDSHRYLGYNGWQEANFIFEQEGTGITDSGLTTSGNVSVFNVNDRFRHSVRIGGSGSYLRHTYSNILGCNQLSGLTGLSGFSTSGFYQWWTHPQGSDLRNTFYDRNGKEILRVEYDQSDEAFWANDGTNHLIRRIKPDNDSHIGVEFKYTPDTGTFSYEAGWSEDIEFRSLYSIGGGSGYERNNNLMIINMSGFVNKPSASDWTNHTRVYKKSLYPATYDFRNDTVGGDPAGWTLTETHGTINVVSDFKGHKKVVEMDEDDESGWLLAYQYPSANQDNGTIEAWVLLDTKGSQAIISCYDDSDSTLFGIGLEDDQDIVYYHGVGSQCSIDWLPNKWYHVKMYFDCDNDTWSLWINGILEADGVSFHQASDGNGLNYIRFAQYGGKQYFDAVGYSWDSGYTIGDNRYPEDSYASWMEINSQPIDSSWNGGNHDAVSFLVNNVLTEPKYYGTYDFNDLEWDDDDGQDGLYQGTYSFEDDTVGGNPAGWTMEDEDGGTIDVVSSYDDHSKVVKFETTSANAIKMSNTISQTDGTIECWFEHDLAAGKQFYPIQLYESSTVRLLIYTSSDHLYYWDGGGNDLGVISSGWHHLKLEFDCSDDSFSLWLDAVSLVEPGSFNGNATTIDYHKIGTNAVDNVIAYVDAIGYSWDTDYTVGDNDPMSGIERYGDYIANVVDNIGNHNNVLRMYDAPGGSSSYCLNYFTSRESGTIECWMRTSDATERSQITLQSDDGGGTDCVWLYLVDDDWQYFDGAVRQSVPNVNAPSDDTWHHVLIHFECGAGGYQGLAADQVEFIIDGVSSGAIGFATAVNDIYRISLYSISENGGNVYSYFDALGYSWDSNYEIGSNWFPKGPYEMDEVLIYYGDTDLGDPGYTSSLTVTADSPAANDYTVQQDDFYKIDLDYSVGGNIYHFYSRISGADVQISDTTPRRLMEAIWIRNNAGAPASDFASSYETSPTITILEGSTGANAGAVLVAIKVTGKLYNNAAAKIQDTLGEDVEYEILYIFCDSQLMKIKSSIIIHNQLNNILYEKHNEMYWDDGYFSHQGYKHGQIHAAETHQDRVLDSYWSTKKYMGHFDTTSNDGVFVHFKDENIINLEDEKLELDEHPSIDIFVNNPDGSADADNYAAGTQYMDFWYQCDDFTLDDGSNNLEGDITANHMNMEIVEYPLSDSGMFLLGETGGTYYRRCLINWKAYYDREAKCSGIASGMNLVYNEFKNTSPGSGFVDAIGCTWESGYRKDDNWQDLYRWGWGINRSDSLSGLSGLWEKYFMRDIPIGF